MLRFSERIPPQKYLIETVKQAYKFLSRGDIVSTSPVLMVGWNDLALLDLPADDPQFDTAWENLDDSIWVYTELGDVDNHEDLPLYRPNEIKAISVFGDKIEIHFQQYRRHAYDTPEASVSMTPEEFIDYANRVLKEELQAKDEEIERAREFEREDPEGWGGYEQDIREDRDEFLKGLLGA